jgi:hypothetical protein
LESRCGQRFAAESRAQGRRAGRPAAARRGVAGSPVGRFGVGPLGGHGQRSGQPARTPPRQPVLRRMPTSAGFASACRPSSDRGRPRSRGRRWWLRIGSGAHPAPPARRSALPPSAGAHPGGRRSVIGVEHFPARGRGGDVALSPSPPPSFGRKHGRRARRRRRPCRLASVVSPQPEVVAPPGRWRPPGQVAWAVATFGRALERANVAVLSPGVGASTPEWGPFRTLNWTLNAESRPQRERRAAGRRAQNPAISRQNWEVARPGIEPGTPRFSVVCSTD